ncbi:MAG TPA: serine/threonine-protein kinase [Bacteriovoracaceae bacterium]|nr:serine/threonine-protein kinase [Bacteriovoracaceae bacterium]
MSEKKFQRFGKYLILDHLVDGGMAKICRARYLGEQANKVVAIKMVQPQFSNDEAFVRMFQDELNITFGMLHPNIMQVYDYGKTNGQLYTAMEYIHGANLKQYLDRLKDKKKGGFAVEISCYIISQVCQGLHYAHTFTDKLTGKPYNIIHRDISPHNIMLTYDGAVKVIDFGIAKSNTNSEATQAGTIKGKLSYLAPEYLEGIELDARYDEFALGVTLWELLCSQKLFQASNDLAVLKQIQACKIRPPSEINPTVPKELDAIVMKALSKDRSNRYEDLDQMNRALVRFLYSKYPEFNASDLRKFADDLFGQEIARDRDKFVEYGKIETQAYIDDMKNEESRTGKINRKEIPGGKPDLRSTVRELELPISPQVNIEIYNKTDVNKTKKVSKPSIVAPSTGVKNTRVTTGITRRVEKTATQGMPKHDLETEEEQSSSGRQITMLIFAASFAALAYFQPALVGSFFGIKDPEIADVTPVGKPPRGPANTPQSTTDTPKPAATGATADIIFSGVDNVSMEVFINGVKAEYIGGPVKVAMNEEITIVVKKTGYTPYVTKVTLTDNQTAEVISVPPLEKTRLGLLTTSLNYTAGSKLVYEENGELVEKDLPFKDLQFTEGSYVGKIVNPILGTEKRVQFTIEENKKHFLE